MTPLTAMSYVDSPICWSTFIRRMILSDVNIYRYRWRSILPEAPRDVEVVDIYVGSRHEYEELLQAFQMSDPRNHSDDRFRLIVQFHNTLLTVRGTQALVSFAPLAFKLFCAARQNAKHTP